ncbi:hypothetical protein FACS1894162_3830 [Bacteroidia bacterium]|nr:hypothetical protein FACS1894162_3830 [Bacteroidia bacterium]
MIKRLDYLIELIDENHAKLLDILSGYCVKELEVIALRVYLKPKWSVEYIDTPEHKLLELALECRKRKLDADFVFKPTVLEKIRQLDAQIMACQEKLCKEAEQEIVRLNQKKETGNTFLNEFDFVLECKVTPYIFKQDTERGVLFDEYDGIDELVSAMFPVFLLHFDGETSEHLRGHEYFKEKINWNESDMPIQVDIADFRISWGMHELCGHSPFSLSDILRINYLWGDIKIVQTHFVEL